MTAPGKPIVIEIEPRKVEDIPEPTPVPEPVPEPMPKKVPEKV